MADERRQLRTAQVARTPGADAPVVVFDHVSLAFDEKVVLKDVSFTLRHGPHEDHPRRERVGQVDDAEDHHSACCAPTPASSG